MIACIPTKSRKDTKTHIALESAGFEVYHFIEPQEINEYKVKNPINIMKNNMGITYVRNFIVDWAKENNHRVILVCDDDVTSFGVSKNNKSVKTKDASPIAKCYRVFEKSDFALGGFNMRQFAWSEKKPYKVNRGKVEGCVLINTQKVNWKYRDNTKEDRDYLMQCLDNLMSFVFFGKVFYNTQAIGTGKGGLHDLYDQNIDAKWAFKLKSDWIGYTKIVRQYGRVDCKVDYKQKAIDMGLKVL